MDQAAVRQDGHRPDHLRDEAVDLGRRHQPGEVLLGLQERLPAVGHQVIHVERGLHRHGLQCLTQFLTLGILLGELTGDRLLGAGFDVRVGEQARQVADILVRFRNLALEPGRLAAIRFERLARHRRDLIEDAVHVIEDGAHRRLDAGHELVFADRRLVVAGFRAVRLPPAAGVVAVRAFGVAALARVVDAPAAGTEQVPGERPDLRRFTRAVNAIRGKLRLRSLERLIVDDAQRLVAVHDVAVLIRPARHAVPRGPVELEAAPQVADFTDQHPVRQDAADRPESPRPAEPRRHAALTHAAGDLLEAD
ncbi:MAG: hypothetical protein M5U20_05615 [Phycisphaerales bacterium]|nr:hypothetical protein [Phycisphaerales bacterium]